jgi:hypothetical protein
MQSHKKVVSVAVQRVADSRVWVAVSLSLRQEEYEPGEYYIDYSDDFRCNIRPLNDEAAKAFEEQTAEDAAEATAAGEEYVCSWGGYIAQGTRHGFRLQKAPDRRVIVSSLEGCLGLDGDVEGIIWAGTLGVVLLLGGDGSQVETPGWRMMKCSID